MWAVIARPEAKTIMKLDPDFMLTRLVKRLIDTSMNTHPGTAFSKVNGTCFDQLADLSCRDGVFVGHCIDIF
jgi:hypothetical protein